MLETLLEVCVLSSHAWTATDLSDRPLAFMGVVPIPGVPDTGHVWLEEVRRCGLVHWKFARGPMSQGATP